jgi:hypothetical protein
MTPPNALPRRRLRFYGHLENTARKAVVTLRVFLGHRRFAIHPDVRPLVSRKNERFFAKGKLLGVPRPSKWEGPPSLRPTAVDGTTIDVDVSAMSIDAAAILRTLADLVRIDSINPAFSNGTTNDSDRRLRRYPSA